MVVIFVEAANGHLLFAAPQLALDVVVFPAVAGFQPQSAVGPELSFGAETMRGLDQCHRQSRANRSQGGNLPQFGSDRMLATLPQHAYAGLAVVYRLEIIETQQIGKFAGIDLVAFVAMFEQRVLARVAHY